MKPCIKYFAATIITFGLSSASFADIMVIGHTDLRIAPLDKKEVRSLYLNKPIKGFKGKKIQLILPPPESATGTKFIKEVLRMTPGKFKSHWASQIFTGKGSEPTYTDSLDEILEIIESNTRAIAVIDAVKAPKSTKLFFSFNSINKSDTLSQLERLQALRDNGALTKKEFQAAKNRLLEK